MNGFRLPSDDDIITDIKVSPLVDIIMVFIIVFTIATVISDFRALEANLPQAAVETTDNGETISIVISKAGSYYLDGQPVSDIEHLNGKLLQEKAKNPNICVNVSSDRISYHEPIARFLDIAGQTVIDGLPHNGNGGERAGKKRYSIK